MSNMLAEVTVALGLAPVALPAQAGHEDSVAGSLQRPQVCRPVLTSLLIGTARAMPWPLWRLHQPGALPCSS